VGYPRKNKGLQADVHNPFIRKERLIKNLLQSGIAGSKDFFEKSNYFAQIF